MTAPAGDWFNPRLGSRRERRQKRRQRRPLRTTLQIPRQNPKRKFLLREKPAYEEEHYSAGILGVPPVDATAANRSVATPGRDYVRGGDRALLWRRDGWAFVVWRIHAFGGDFAQPVGTARLCRLFAAAHYDCLSVEPGFYSCLRLCCRV